MANPRADEKEFMERRRREAARRSGAGGIAGRSSSGASTATGGEAAPEAGFRYGNLYAPAPEDFAGFHQQQSEFGAVRRDLDKENWWMAVPALAPAAVVMGLEGAGVIAARYAPRLSRGPLVLPNREPVLRVGDNWATRAGRRAHKALKERVDQKPGWKAEEAVKTEQGVLRPDVKAPVRPTKPRSPYQMELKPNTPSGRRAGARAAERYERATGKKTRPIYYDPKDFM